MTSDSATTASGGTMGVGRMLAWLGLVVGVVALVVQFVISMQAYLAAGRDVPGGLGVFFSYYTILTNIVLLLIYLSELTNASWLGWARNLDFRGMMLAVMILVASFVHFYLRHLVDLSGLFKVCDVLLHYITPLIYLVWWVIGVRHGPMLARRVPAMLLPTIVYFLYVLARGAWTGDYPYPVFNVAQHGYGHVLLYAVALLVGLGALALIVVGVDEFLGLRKRRIATAS